MPYKQKPLIWTCDPGTIAYNCAQLGLPVPVGAWVLLEKQGTLLFDLLGHRNLTFAANSPRWNVDHLNFDTGIEYASGNHHPAFNFGNGPFSLVAALRTSYTSQSQYFISKNYGAAGVKWWALTVLNQVTFFADDGSDTHGKENIADIADGKWHQVICTKRRDTESRVFVDGKDDSAAGVISGDYTADNTEDIYLGSRADLSAIRDVIGDIKYAYIFSDEIIPRQAQILYDNPYGMFEPLRRPPIWSIPSGSTINFFGTSGIQTSTKGAAFAVTRPLSGTSALASATTSAILAILRVLSGTAAAQSSTTSAVLALIRALDGTSGGTTQTSSPILNILRALSGTSTPQSATSDAILAVARALAGTSAIQSCTSDAEMTLEGLITFLGTAAGVTQTKDAILAVARDLSGTSAGQSVVADAILAILRSLTGTSAAQSKTTDATLKNLRSLSGTSAAQSATTDAAMALLRALTGTAAIDSATSEAILAILRELEGSADMASATSDAIMALAALGVLVDTILESLTPVRTVESLTPVRTVEST